MADEKVDEQAMQQAKANVADQQRARAETSVPEGFVPVQDTNQNDLPAAPNQGGDTSSVALSKIISAQSATGRPSPAAAPTAIPPKPPIGTTGALSQANNASIEAVSKHADISAATRKTEAALGAANAKSSLIGKGLQDMGKGRAYRKDLANLRTDITDLHSQMQAMPQGAIAGEGMIVGRVGGKLHLRSKATGGGGKKKSTKPPWTFKASASGLGGYNIRLVVLGTLNAQLATNTFIGGKLWNFSLGGGGPYYIYLAANTDGTSVASYVISTSGTEPAPPGNQVGSAPSTFNKVLCILMSGKIYRTIGDGELIATPQITLTTSKAAPVCAEDPLDRHYTWNITS